MDIAYETVSRVLAEREARRAASSIPLSRAALCLGWETVFEINGHCPACYSSHFVPLARWLQER